MQECDRASFTQGLLVLAEIHNRKLSEVTLKTYWCCLRIYPFDVFKKTLWRFIKHPDYAQQGFPSPALWIKSIEGDSQTKSLCAWNTVLRAIRQWGRYHSVQFGDKLIHVIIQEMGGWMFLCQQIERELFFLQKEFERRYRYYLSTQQPSRMPQYLVGALEHQNQIQGYTNHIPKPIEVGNDGLQKTAMAKLSEEAINIMMDI